MRDIAPTRADLDKLRDILRSLVGVHDVSDVRGALVRVLDWAETMIPAPHPQPGLWIGDSRWWGPGEDDRAALVFKTFSGFQWVVWRPHESHGFDRGIVPTWGLATAAADKALALLTAPPEPAPEPAPEPEPLIRRRSEADQLTELRALVVLLTERVARLEAAASAPPPKPAPEAGPGSWIGNVRWWGSEGEDLAATVSPAFMNGWSWNVWRRKSFARFACGACPTREEAVAAADAALAGLS